MVLKWKNRNKLRKTKQSCSEETARVAGPGGSPEGRSESTVGRISEIWFEFSCSF